MQHYISINGCQYGPMEDDELRNKIASGEIRVGETLYWCPGMANWLPLCSVMQSLFPGLIPPRTPEQEAEYDLMSAFKSVMKRYAMFTGRASITEYWYFMLVSYIIGFIPIINILWILVVLIPGIAVAIRRMHDVGKSGWYSLIPIYSLILACQPSEGPNQYGEKPLPPEQ